jgi:toxin-antitoxin system PIN domain toxin
VILLDVNLLVYAHVVNAPQHTRARDWLDGRLAGPGRVGFPWHSLAGFVRIVTNGRMVVRPVTVADAWRQVEEWLDNPTAWVPQPGDGHRALFGQLLREHGGGNLVPDAHLAAIAIEHGLTLCSVDDDFARFKGLRRENPLAR